MSKEEYYSKIKKFVYRRFEELEVVKSNDGNNIYLHYKNEEYAQILAEKKSGELIYHYSFANKIIKPIPMAMHDFEILLKRWVEETFKMKVSRTKGIFFNRVASFSLPIKFR